MSAYIQAITDFIAQHPHWAGILVFLTAAGEAIAVVGSFIPGTTILVGVGAVIGLGHLPLWPILIWATLGAIAGDGLSYWLGHRYGHHVARLWPFSRRPQLIAQGEAFFRRHGAKSVVIGRFLPVTRAVIPLVAGSLGMPPLRFSIANVLSAIVWAPLHILPGVALGGLLTVLGGISGRLVALLLGVLLLAAALAWLLRVAVLRLAPLAARLQVAVFDWAAPRQGLVPRAIAGALDPGNPGARTVLLLGTLGAACGIGFINLLEDVVEKDSVIRADAAVSNFVQGFRTAWADHLMIAVTMLGDGLVSLAVAAAATGWLLWRRQWRLAAGFAATIALAEASVTLLKLTLQQPRPIAIYSGADAFSFPSGHATLSAVLYGMLAWLIATGLSPRGRVVALAAAGAMVGMIAASRIYLAAHWPSDVGAGITLGFTLAVIFALVYRRTEETHQHLFGLLPVVLVVLLGVGGWHVWHGFDGNLERYAQRTRISTTSLAEWRASGWQTLARQRVDLAGEAEEPFVLQWAGTSEALAARLSGAGWTAPPAWSLQTAAAFASPAATAGALPCLPLLHDGRAPVVMLILPQAGARLVLRAWPSDLAVQTAEGTGPVLLASLVRERLLHPWGLATVVHDEAVTGAAAQAVLAAGGLQGASPEPGLLIAGP